MNTTVAYVARRAAGRTLRVMAWCVRQVALALMLFGLTMTSIALACIGAGGGAVSLDDFWGACWSFGVALTLLTWALMAVFTGRFWS